MQLYVTEIHMSYSPGFNFHTFLTHERPWAVGVISLDMYDNLSSRNDSCYVVQAWADT